MVKEKKNVLLVESQRKVVEEIKNELIAQGYNVSVSGSVEKALFRAKAFHFDLFVVNAGDDGKEGYNFLSNIKKETSNQQFSVLFLLNPKVKVDVRLRKYNQPFDIVHLPFDDTEFKIRIDRLMNSLQVENAPVQEPILENVKVTSTAKTESKVNGRVLLVEDNPLNQKVLGMFITKLGFEHDVASNGQASVDLCTSTEYAFILMDVYMPGMDGTEATEKIRELENKTGHRAKIIAITANESEESVKRCYDSGMDDYLVKPFTLDILKEKLV
jgi:DNA-binding response OmpR family regulator